MRGWLSVALVTAVLVSGCASDGHSTLAIPRPTLPVGLPTPAVTLPSGTPTVLPTSRPTITVTRPKYHVSLATFAGGWTAHTRFLRISRAGVGKEWVDDGCCHHEFHLTFELSRVWGSPDNAIAEFVITAFTPGEPGYFDAQHPAPRVGQKGQLRVREHTIVETATDTRFCSDGHALPQPNVCGV